MTRRKSVCLNWTLVLLVVLVPSVYTRPQETPATATISGLNDKSTESTLRYRNAHNNISLNSFNKLPVVISTVNKTTAGSIPSNSTYLSVKQASFNSTKDMKNRNLSFNRTSRLIHSSIHSNLAKNKHKPSAQNIHTEEIHLQTIKKPAIKKVITKWRDKTKYDDLNFYETTVTSEQTKDRYSHVNDDSSTESSEQLDAKRYTLPQYDSQYNMYNKPRPQYSEESHVYSTNIQVIEANARPNNQYIDYNHHTTRPPYFQTYIPTPTPIVTNVGYPKPWTQTVRRTTTQRPKPTKYEYNVNSNNHGGNYEVTTFEPTNSYTDKIIIRPEDYSPDAEDCPTIYLTLNNTFQGQGKEACPDLNINVNTNVINKNVVESEEDDSLFPGLGLGLGDDSGIGEDSSKGEDYFESEENTDQVESASVEGTELSNYHSANSPIQAESNEASGHGSTNSHSALKKPGRPGFDDDIFNFSSFVDFFRPAFNALAWLATINPFSVGIFPLFLAPLGFIFAGSGFAALFAPWFLPLGRESPKIIHVYRPEWEWDHHLKTWQLHSFPNNRKIISETGRTNIKRDEDLTHLTLISKLKNWMIHLTNKLKQKQTYRTVSNERKAKRKKRETWTSRVT